MKSGLIFLSSNLLTLHNKNNKLFRKITKKAPFFKKKSFFFKPFILTFYPNSYELNITKVNADIVIFIKKIAFILTLSKVSIRTEMAASSNIP